MHKTMVKRAVTLLLFLAFFIATGQAQNLRVTEIAFATGIQNRHPVDADTAFANNVGRVYCYTHLEGARDTTQITHVWYYKDQEKAHIDLKVASDDWRTWSSKSILKSWTGPWRVMIEDGNGNVLASKSFVIK